MHWPWLVAICFNTRKYPHLPYGGWEEIGNSTGVERVNLSYLRGRIFQMIGWAVIRPHREGMEFSGMKNKK